MIIKIIDNKIKAADVLILFIFYIMQILIKERITIIIKLFFSL